MHAARPRVVRAALAATTLIALSGVTGCGEAKGPAEKAEAQADPDKAATDCREKWADLGDEVADKADRTDPSALPQRWNTVAATIDYYATSGTGKDCGDRLDGQRTAITALTAFEAKLRPYDVPYRLAQVRTSAAAYTGKPVAKGKKPPTKAAVTAALKTVESQAATATQQQGPAWAQAAVVDLADTAATAKAVKDLAFLSSESAAYRACTQALSTINAAVATTR